MTADLRPIAFGALVALAASCATSTPAVSPTPAPAPPTSAAASTPDPGAPAGYVKLVVPPRVAGFRALERKTYPDPRDGVLVRYVSADSLSADVFVYPGPDFATDCPLECARGVIGREVDGFRSDFPELIRRDYVKEIAVVHDDTLAPPPGVPWRVGRHLLLTVRRADHPQRSDFYLFYLPGYRVKIRSTFDETPQRRHELEAFVPAVVAAFAR